MAIPHNYYCVEYRMVLTGCPCQTDDVQYPTESCVDFYRLHPRYIKGDILNSFFLSQNETHFAHDALRF